MEQQISDENKQNLIDAVVSRHLATVPLRDVIRVYNDSAIIHFSRMSSEELEKVVKSSYPDLVPLFYATQPEAEVPVAAQ
jgi:hypothetical protein